MDPSLTTLPISTSTNSSTDSPAGIHCANPDCRTRAGERSRGHQSCRALLCGHCCQNAARTAAEAGEQRPVCKVHARRVHTGHKPVPKEQQAEGSTSSIAVTNNVNGVGWAGSGVGEPEELHDLLEKRARLEQSLKRSLTMVVWYRVSCSREISSLTTLLISMSRMAANLFVSHTRLQPSLSSSFKTSQSSSGSWVYSLRPTSTRTTSKQANGNSIRFQQCARSNKTSAYYIGYVLVFWTA